MLRFIFDNKEYLEEPLTYACSVKLPLCAEDEALREKILDLLGTSFTEIQVNKDWISMWSNRNELKSEQVPETQEQGETESAPSPFDDSSYFSDEEVMAHAAIMYGMMGG